tara:strand:- start:1153 stop:1467 length:315 start_codon:yes stop_codon:yes gene_type:complete
MNTYIKIKILDGEDVVYIPIEKILLPFYSPADGAGTIKVGMSTSYGNVGFSLEFDGVTTLEETKAILGEFNKAIACNPGGRGIVNLGGEFNKLSQGPEYTEIFS